MLLRLSIHNIALIESMDLEFGGGLNVLSGETGAGKSIIVDALGLVRGDKTQRMLVGLYGDSARVEGVFDVGANAAALAAMSEYGLDGSEGLLILSREIGKSGPSICRANAQTVTLAALRRLGDALVDIHGQHEHQSLFDQRTQMPMLDRFGGRETLEAVRAVAKAFRRYTEIEDRLREKFGDESDREKRMDFLRFQTEEIAAARLRPDEEEELSALRKRMQNAQRITDTLTEAYDLLYGDTDGRAATAAVDRALSGFEQIRALDPEYERLAEKLRSAYYALEEIALDVRDLRAAFSYDPQLLEETQTRLDRIARLKRKYGPTVRDVLAFYESAAKELEELENSAEVIARLESERAGLAETLFSQCTALHRARAAAAGRLAEQVRAQLKDLGLEKARFEIALSSPPASPGEAGGRMGPGGFDNIEFLISPNVGQDLMPLARIVSGGEASRIMLALKTIVAELDDVGTLVFDEIDTGLSGRIAHIVAQKLGMIAKDRQVLCITHLPQIAAMADAHFLIEKSDDSKKTFVSVSRLDPEGEIGEIARLSGAGRDKTAVKAHARQMKSEADAFKRGRG
jgi:DNA repair protein RecN (Recombination protein N)